MTDRSITHATFTLERVYNASMSRVFGAWADPDAKARWFAGPAAEHQLDFQVGGEEVNRAHLEDGRILTFKSLYRDIVPNERIVYTSTLSEGETVATVSVTTVELSPAGEGTRLFLTEQGAFLNGLEEPSWREQGTSDWLAALGAELEAQSAQRRMA